MNDVLHLLWQINYMRDSKDALVLIILHVSKFHEIAGKISWDNNELSFGSTGECIYLLNTRFDKGILV